MAGGCSGSQVPALVRDGVLATLGGILGDKNTELVISGLAGLEHILRFGETAKDEENLYADEFEASGGLNWLEDLQYHNEERVREKALKVLNEFYVPESDLDVS